MKKIIVTLALAALMSVFTFGQNPPAGGTTPPAGEKMAPAKKKRAKKKVKKAADKAGEMKPAEKKP